VSRKLQIRPVSLSSRQWSRARPLGAPCVRCLQMGHATAFTGVAKVREGSVAAGLPVSVPTLSAATSIGGGNEPTSKAREGSVAAALLGGGASSRAADLVHVDGVRSDGVKPLSPGTLVAASARFALPAGLMSDGSAAAAPLASGLGAPPQPPVATVASVALGPAGGSRLSMRRSTGRPTAVAAAKASADVLKRREAAIATAKGMYLSVQVRSPCAAR